MVGSKCRDFKNREVSNVNAPLDYVHFDMGEVLLGNNREGLSLHFRLYIFDLCN